MKMKKLVALVLAFVMIFCNVFSTNALDIIGEMITENITGMNQLSVSAALNNYFNSREAFLLNQSDTINVPLAGVVEDEMAHKVKYESEDIIYVDSIVSIDDTLIYDTQAHAEVTETVTYVKDGVTNTETVAHKLFLGLNNNNVPVVISDRYRETFSNFKSCSYVDEANTASINSVGGSDRCIVHVAEGEIGYTEGTDGYTKYGDWYYDGFERDEWCVMFVAWCAAQANISESVIHKYANQTYMQVFFADQGRYYSRSAAVDSLAPEAGDLVFFTKNGVDASHIGIVQSVDASNIYVVHGNWPNAVILTEFSRTDAYILGYAKPAYESDTHDWARRSDSSGHWYACNNCGFRYSTEEHSLVKMTTGTQHWYECEVCDYQEGRGNHTYTTTYTKTSSKHYRYCTTCSYRVDYDSHVAELSYSMDSTHHWKDCKTCGYDMYKGEHTFTVTGDGFYCNVCGYITDSIQYGLRPTDVTAQQLS